MVVMGGRRGSGMVGRIGVHGLAVDAFPERGPFVVGEGVEEGLPERALRVLVGGFHLRPAVAGSVAVVVGLGIVVVWWGGRLVAVGAVVVVVMAAGVSGVQRCG